MTLSKEMDQLIKQRDSAIQEAHLWRSELAKAREQAVILEGAVVRAEEKVRVAEADAEARIREAVQRESATANEKHELLAYVNMLQAQLTRFIILSVLKISQTTLFVCIILLPCSDFLETYYMKFYPFCI